VTWNLAAIPSISNIADNLYFIKQVICFSIEAGRRKGNDSYSLPQIMCSKNNRLKYSLKLFKKFS
jgi:hypothetical protein